MIVAWSTDVLEGVICKVDKEEDDSIIDVRVSLGWLFICPSG